MNYGLAASGQCFETHHAAVRPKAIRWYKYCRGAYFLCASEAICVAVRHRAVGHFDLFRDWDELHREDIGKTLVRVAAVCLSHTRTECKSNIGYQDCRLGREDYLALTAMADPH